MFETSADLKPSDHTQAKFRRRLNVMSRFTMFVIIVSLMAAGWSVVWYAQQVANGNELAERGIPTTGSVDRVIPHGRGAHRTAVSFMFEGEQYRAELPGLPPVRSASQVQLLVDSTDPENVRFSERPNIDRNWIVVLAVSATFTLWSIKVTYGVREGIKVLNGGSWTVASITGQVQWGRWTRVHVISSTWPRGRRVTALARSGLFSWTSTRWTKTGWVSESNGSVLFIADGSATRFLAGRAWRSVPRNAKVGQGSFTP